jgi:hypothetical protein
MQVQLARSFMAIAATALASRMHAFVTDCTALLCCNVPLSLQVYQPKDVLAMEEKVLNALTFQLVSFTNLCENCHFLSDAA